MKNTVLLIISLVSLNSLAEESKFIITLDKRIYQNYELEKKKTIQNTKIMPECGFSHEGKFISIEELDSYCIIGDHKNITVTDNRIEWFCEKEQTIKNCYAIIVDEE